MNVGIIGYGSMGKMLTEKFSASGKPEDGTLFVSGRTKDSLKNLPEGVAACGSNGELAACSDVVFLCVRPPDMGGILEEIRPERKQGSLLVSLNGSVSFALLEKAADGRIAKVIPSVTAEVNRSQTLLCCNGSVTEDDRKRLKELLGCIGDVIELPEEELGMGSELVSCMPGFIASIFDVLCRSAKKHTGIPYDRVVGMVLNTLAATGELMLKKGMSFDDVVSRVATKGGITGEGTGVIYDRFPAAADELFEKTLEKRSRTARQAEEAFGRRPQ